MLHVDYFIECNTIHDLKKKNINKMWVSDDSFIVITNSLQKKKTLLNDITLSSIEYWESKTKQNLIQYFGVYFYNMTFGIISKAVYRKITNAKWFQSQKIHVYARFIIKKKKKNTQFKE